MVMKDIRITIVINKFYTYSLCNDYLMIKLRFMHCVLIYLFFMKWEIM